MSVSSFDFSTTSEPVPVRIDGQDHLLREATGEAAKKYRNAAAAAAKMRDGEIAGFGDIAGIEHVLLSLCLFKVAPGGGEQPVPLAVVQAWPNRIIKPLYEKAREISHLQEAPDLVKRSLLSALRRPDAPCTFEAFRDWALDLDGPEHRHLRRLFKGDEEDDLKKQQPNSIPGSAQPASSA